ncbi:iron-sulfur cluster assembly accessory protein [Acetobacteraceae bacterium]|nr:iron-sulfur cluster assembly accessory protein [Acetobacteraceae bacterium]
MTHDFLISSGAKKRISEILSDEKTVEGQKSGVRILVDAGGCNGYQYKFSIDKANPEEDIIFEEDGAIVLIDKLSLDLIKGSELQYEDELMGAHFKIKNPNAASCCGCGNSFSLPEDEDD